MDRMWYHLKLPTSIRSALKALLGKRMVNEGSDEYGIIWCCCFWHSFSHCYSQANAVGYTTSVGTAKAEISNQFIVLPVSRKLQHGVTTGT